MKYLSNSARSKSRLVSGPKTSLHSSAIPGPALNSGMPSSTPKTLPAYLPCTGPNSVVVCCHRQENFGAGIGALVAEGELF